MKTRIMLSGRDKTIEHKCASLRQQHLCSVVKYNDGLPLLGKPVWRLAFGGVAFNYVYKPSSQDKRDIISVKLLPNPGITPTNKVINRMNQSAEVLTFVGHPDDEQVLTIFQREYTAAAEALEIKAKSTLKNYIYTEV